jgi:hypothetical protein
MPHQLFRKTKGDLLVFMDANSSSLPATPENSFLYTAAIEQLIEQADISKWEQRGRAELDEDAFLASILQAVARTFMAHHSQMGGGESVYETLKKLVDDLHRRVDL